MQALWLAFEDIAGKGIDMVFILKFLYYTALIVTPQALPIGVLLSSIMALGNLSENYEFAAAKSAGISLPRLLRPLIILTVVLSVVNFFFLNNVFPYAMYKQKNLYVNIKKQKPLLAFIPGVFNTEIPGYHIKFDEVFGENEDQWKKVLIYDLTDRRGNNKIITAKTAKIINPEGQTYMTLVLNDGFFFEDHLKSRKSRINMPTSSATFKQRTITLSMPRDSISEDGNLQSKGMKTLDELDLIIPELEIDYKDYIKGRSKSFYTNTGAKELHPTEVKSTDKKLATEILDNFEAESHLRIINASILKNKTAIDIIKNQKNTFKFKRKKLNIYETEYYNRIAFSLSCLILFFIGAPLGSIIRKGGFGLPMILAISIYVIYFFVNTFGRNLAEDSSVSTILGSWVSAMLMVPLGIFLTVRATKDKGIFNIDVFLQPITQLIKKISSNKDNLNNGEH